MTAHSYHFRPAIMEDLPMLRGWLAGPEVARWWSPKDPFDADDLANPGFEPAIVSLGDTPFAYVQTYDPDIEPGHHFGHLPRGARGIDQFIGLPEMLGRGHGTGFLRQHVATLFAAGVPAIGTDPHPDNARAIAAYRKVGFEVAGPAQETRWGLILPMEAWPDEPDRAGIGGPE